MRFSLHIFDHWKPEPCKFNRPMLPKSTPKHQLTFMNTFEEQLDRRHPLYRLVHEINWELFEQSFAPLYSTEGRPAKPIRLMVSLLILKHLRNLSDQSVVSQWAENSYFQYFGGAVSFCPSVPCEASELVHFRYRIGEEGIALILKESIRVNGDDGNEPDVSVDTTVQEKNITYPTDAKLHRKIIRKCRKISDQLNLPVRQSYVRVLKKLGVDQRFRNHPKNKGRARKADRKVRVIAGRLVREIERHLPPCHRYSRDIELFKRVLAQKRTDRHKIYSLHEPEVQCISKGKDHKKYEFGNKVSIAYTQNTGVIVGALSFRNEYDGHTLDKVLPQVEALRGHAPKTVTADRGYRGKKMIGDTQIHTPQPFNSKQTHYRQAKLRKKFRRRAAIEPVIGHLKADHRLSRNFYKGIFGDNINIMLAAAAFNFKRMINKWAKDILGLFLKLFSLILYDNSKRFRKKMAGNLAF